MNNLGSTSMPVYTGQGLHGFWRAAKVASLFLVYLCSAVYKNQSKQNQHILLYQRYQRNSK